MRSIEIRNNFHRLIDKISNESILSKFYDILERASKTEEGKLWERLTEEEKNELLVIDRETENDKNLISHSKMQEKHKKWL